MLREVAASLGVPARLALVLPELFRGVSSLGSEARRLARALASEGIGPASRVLDLACGKGALAVELAGRVGCRVVGVDGFGPFLDEARELARRRGVARRCEFVHGDVRRPPLEPGRLFDGAIMIGLFGAARASSVLRRWVKPGGVYLLDDAVRAPGVRGRSAAPTLATSRLVLERRGDCILREIALSRAAASGDQRRVQRTLARNVGRMALAHPGLAPLLDEFVAQQRSAERALCRSLCPMAWVVRRGAG